MTITNPEAGEGGFGTKQQDGKGEITVEFNSEF
jgi:hypothetical protein